MEQRSKISFLVDLTFALSIGFIIYFCAKFLLGYLLPFVIASVIAWIVQKPAKKIAGRVGIKNGICAVFLSLVIFIVTAFLIFFALYRGVVFVGEALNKMPQMITATAELLENIRNRFGSIFSELSPKTVSTLNGLEGSILETLGTKLTGYLSAVAATVAKKTPSLFLSILVTLVATCYISKDFDRLLRFIKELCGEKLYSKIIDIKTIFTTSVWKLIKGYAIILTVTFLELLIGFFLIGIRHPIFLAFIVSLIDLLPVLGTGTVLIPWGLIRLFLGYKNGFIILGIYIFITFLRNFLEPRIIGKQMGINPLFTLIVMFAGLKLIGFWGIIIFPIIFIVVFKYYKQQLEEN